MNSLKKIRTFPKKTSAPKVNGTPKVGVSTQENTSSIVVILVDMQTGFVENLRGGELERIVPNQLFVLKQCNTFNIPLIVLEFIGYGKTISKLMVEAEKNPFFKLITKYRDSGFEGTALDEHLALLGAKKIILMGINADYCVRKTAADAIENGYQIITSNDIISGQSHHPADNNISWFSSNGTCIQNIIELPQLLNC